MKQYARNKYIQLLFTLIFVMLAATLVPPDQIGSLFLSLPTLSVMVLIIKTFYQGQKVFRIYIAMAILAFILEICVKLELFPQEGYILSCLSLLIYSIFISLAIILILNQIFSDRKVTKSTLVGSICVYLLLGIFWLMLYRSILIFSPNAFSQPLDFICDSYTLIYFSFTTLTTLGYGDIYPVIKIAKFATNLEAIVGQMYVAIIISRLVGLYSSEDIQNQDTP